MYKVDANDAQVLLKYSDVFSGKCHELKDEIEKLNMHKSNSVICELIRVRDMTLSADSIKLTSEEKELHEISKVPYASIPALKVGKLVANKELPDFVENLSNKRRNAKHIISMRKDIFVDD